MQVFSQHVFFLAKSISTVAFLGLSWPYTNTYNFNRNYH